MEGECEGEVSTDIQRGFPHGMVVYRNRRAALTPMRRMNCHALLPIARWPRFTPISRAVRVRTCAARGSAVVDIRCKRCVTESPS